MAFNIGSRSGWNRLWVVATILWWAFMAVMVTDGYPTKAKLEYEYEWKISHRDIFGGGNLTPTQLNARRMEATNWYTNELRELPDNQRRYLINAAPYTLLPFGVYLFCLLLVIVVKWVIRGFRTPEHP